MGYRVIPPGDVLRAGVQVSSLDTAGLATGESTEVPTVVQQALRASRGECSRQTGPGLRAQYGWLSSYSMTTPSNSMSAVIARRA
jgi:hypothetical protein